MNVLSNPNINKSFDTTQSSMIGKLYLLYLFKFYYIFIYYVCISFIKITLETPKKTNSRKCYVGDIKTPDLDTPRRAKHYFKLSKINIMNQRKKIKVLNQKVRRLKTKLSNFEALLKHLKKNNYITDDAHDYILVGKN